MGAQMSDDLAFAHKLANAADQISRQRFLSLDLKVETKPDRTPVTDADKSVEKAIRELIAAERPGDSIIGEEFENTGDTDRVWIIDPIDGTANFLRGVPVWATLISLRVAGEYVLGVVSAPAMKRRWWAESGQGAFTEDVDGSSRQIKVSQVKDIADASFSFSSIELWEENGELEKLWEISKKVWRTRAYGDFWSHMMVAEGAVDISAESHLKIFDWAALVPIVTEAGGMLRDQSGELTDNSSKVMASNGILDQQLSELIN
jgi:histidinol-phosphatase